MTAQGTDRVHERWTDNTPYARRTHIYGQIRTLSDDARAAGQPPLWLGVLFLAAGIGGIVGVVKLIEVMV